MTDAADRDALRHHQAAATDVLRRGVACLADGPQAMVPANAGLRAEMAVVLSEYQQFKHARIFDPAIASGDRQRAVLARHMKIACISAGEVFRVHQLQWTPDRIAADWRGYAVAARLTANQLRRHILNEAEGIEDLLAAYA